MDIQILLFLGVLLFALSVVSLSTTLRDEAKSVLKSKVMQAYIISILVFSSLFLVWISGLLYYLFDSNIFAQMILFSSIVFYFVLFSANLYIIKILIKDNEILPKIEKKVLDVILYFVVLWIFSDILHTGSYQTLLVIFTTITALIGFYFVYLLGKYYAYRNLFIIPLEIDLFYLSLVLASISLSFLLLARVYNPATHLFFAVLLEVILVAGVGKLTMEFERYLNKLI